MDLDLKFVYKSVGECSCCGNFGCTVIGNSPVVANPVTLCSPCLKKFQETMKQGIPKSPEVKVSGFMGRAIEDC